MRFRDSSRRHSPPLPRPFGSGGRLVAEPDRRPIARAGGRSGHRARPGADRRRRSPRAAERRRLHDAAGRGRSGTVAARDLPVLRRQGRAPDRPDRGVRRRAGPPRQPGDRAVHRSARAPRCGVVLHDRRTPAHRSRVQRDDVALRRPHVDERARATGPGTSSGHRVARAVDRRRHRGGGARGRRRHAEGRRCRLSLNGYSDELAPRELDGRARCRRTWCSCGSPSSASGRRSPRAGRIGSPCPTTKRGGGARCRSAWRSPAAWRNGATAWTSPTRPGPATRRRLCENCSYCKPKIRHRRRG